MASPHRGVPPAQPQLQAARPCRSSAVLRGRARHDLRIRCDAALSGREERTVSARRRRAALGGAEMADLAGRRARADERPGASFPPLRTRGRSEEPTSALQSLMRLSSDVFCLKKKKTITKI